MYPEQPGVPPPANPYQFITNPPKPSKKLIPSFGGSLPVKIAVIGVGVVILLFTAGFISNLFFGSKTNTDEIVIIAQTETELLRIARQDEKIVDQNLRNTAATTIATIESHRQIWLTFLPENGRKMSQKDLSLKASTATDRKLATALQSNGYDITYSQIIHSQLTTYEGELQAAHASASNPREKNSLKAQLDDTQTLLTLWP